MQKADVYQFGLNLFPAGAKSLDLILPLPQEEGHGG